MGFKRVWSTTGVVALTGALLLTSAPTASADYIRDQQWVMDVFAMEDTWKESQGQGVTVAVIDSGVDASHPDLTGQVLKGKDFTGGGGAQKDIDGHGTAMASMIAAHGHGPGNDSGVMGLAPKSKILPVRVRQKDQDKLLDDTWAKAVRYAVDQGAKVINMSFSSGSAGVSTDAKEALAYAQERDVVLVASTGNTGGDVELPAASPGVIGVGAVDKEGNIWESSNIGKGVSLTAPGVKIVSASPTESSGYQIGSGTSDSTAYVSATAALVRSKYPDLTAGQVANRLIKTASFLHHEGLKAPDDEYGYGIVRPYQAVTKDIPEGAKEGPLGRVEAPSQQNSSSGSAEGGQAQGDGQEGSSGSRNLVLIGGGVAAVVIILGIVFAVMRSRGNRNSGGPSPYGR